MSFRTRVFTVSEETWKEHFQAGVAAINDPLADNNKPQIYATRQKVMTEIAGIRPGDRLFFYIQRTKEIMGGFQATTGPFFDTNPICSSGSTIINYRFPFRIGFQQIINYPRRVHVNEIWAGRDSGQIWTMQQARGDVVGRHACWPLTFGEGNLLDRMLNEINVVIGEPQAVPSPPLIRNPLPIDKKVLGAKFPCLHYEATLQSLILEGLADKKWKELFGDFDDFLPFVSTSEGREIDIVLIKHDTLGKVIWYQLLELKSDRYRDEDLLQLLAYETWLTSNQAGGNTRSVHMVALANRFDDEVKEQVLARKKLKQKPVHLVNYEFNESKSCINLNEADSFDT